LTRILGVDPGAATGIAVYDTDTQKFLRMEETPHGIHGFKEPFKLLLNREELGIDHIVFENFTLRSSNKFTADLSGVEIIGWAKGEQFWGKYNPEPVQHMTLTRLREKADKGKVSPVTTLMKSQGYRIGKGHTRMAGSVCFWYAAKVLNHRETLKMLSEKREK
jgi:hypothetical protein